MGYMYVLGPCAICSQPFLFNADRVPSVRVDGEGERLPLCRSCVEAANPRREAVGLPVIEILPGAYEPAEAL